MTLMGYPRPLGAGGGLLVVSYPVSAAASDHIPMLFDNLARNELLSIYHLRCAKQSSDIELGVRYFGRTPAAALHEARRSALQNKDLRRRSGRVFRPEAAPGRPLCPRCETTFGSTPGGARKDYGGQLIN